MLSEWLGSAVRCSEIERLHGGMLNSVLRLRFDRDPYTAVIKLSNEGEGFAKEALALRHLRGRGFPCPSVYGVSDGTGPIPYMFLLLETIPGVTMLQARLDDADRCCVERELAGVFADLHVHTRGTFGPIGTTGSSSWRDIFMPLLRQVRAAPEVEARLTSEVLTRVDRAIEVAEGVMAAQGSPALIHGDIWGANVMVVRADDGWHLSGLIDPSAQYADAEMELAYLRSFNAPWRDFFEAYTALRPLRPGYELRWQVYWLHTYLVHVFYFTDQHYREKVARAAQKILACA
ncbi:MAG: fructosamine kinase family protein [Anaerolineae bacterium]|nr:fructosamine kinase family protein [Anaerolineae bacterium]